MTSTLALLPGFVSDATLIRGQRGQLRRDGKWALPHRHAWPAALSSAEAAKLRRLGPAARQRPMAEFATSPLHRVHLGRLQNRRIGVLTVGHCADAELAQELGTWAGVGPALAHWIRATLLRLAA